MKFETVVKKVNSLRVRELLALLRNAGIKGYLLCGGDCPLARYVRIKSNVPCSVYVTKTDIGCNGTVTSLSRSARCFINNFDNNKYPELIAHE